MKFRELETTISPLPAFNLNDVRKIDPDFCRQQLSDWQRRNWIQPLAGGYYILTGRNLDETGLWMAANRIYEPSYISLESALAYYQVIPETVFGVTSVSSRKTQTFDSRWGRFSYRSLRPLYLFGYQVVENGAGRKFKIARMEKTVLDMLYLYPGLKHPEDFASLRWNPEALQGILESPLFEGFRAIYSSQALNQRIARLKEYLDA